MTRTLLMWLWPVRMVITWKPKRWSWKAPDNKQSFASIVISWRISSFSKIFLLRWKTKMRGIHLRPNFDEKQGTKSWISREEKDFFKSWKSRIEREMKIRFSRASEKIWSNFFSRIFEIETLVNDCSRPASSAPDWAFVTSLLCPLVCPWGWNCQGLNRGFWIIHDRHLPFPLRPNPHLYILSSVQHDIAQVWYS